MARAGTFIVVGLVAFVAYQVGARQTPVAVAPAPSLTTLPPVQPLASASTQTQTVAPSAPAKTTTFTPPAPAKQQTAPLGKQTEPPTFTTKQKAEAALTAAVIAAIIVQASRQAYYATGRPCACPDDTMRNGRSCGSKSAYSRPGGASPLCFAHDVTLGMIENYRSRVAAR